MRERDYLIRASRFLGENTTRNNNKTRKKKMFEHINRKRKRLLRENKSNKVDISVYEVDEYDAKTMVPPEAVFYNSNYKFKSLSEFKSYLKKIQEKPWTEKIKNDWWFNGYATVDFSVYIDHPKFKDDYPNGLMFYYTGESRCFDNQGYFVSDDIGCSEEDYHLDDLFEDYGVSSEESSKAYDKIDKEAQDVLVDAIQSVIEDYIKDDEVDFQKLSSVLFDKDSEWGKEKRHNYSRRGIMGPELYDFDMSESYRRRRRR